jgi:aspartyl-tRNA(Asn)/glutamyl-tRNA(Gln) amidotransferase subunit A
MVPVALATDGGGSIRIPASFCGVFGIKARFGRVPVWPVAAAPEISHVGPIARTVGDAALVLSVIAGHDPRDPGSVAAPVTGFLGALEQGVAGLRIGWCPSFGYGRVDAAILEACRDAALQLAAQGAQVATLEPPFARDPAPAWNALFYGGIGRRLAELAPTAQQLDVVDPALRAAVAQQRAGTPAGAAELVALREETRARAAAVFREVDVLLTPTLPVTALPVGVDVPPGHAGRNAVDWSYFTYPFNLTGHPAASIPVGFDAQGLPIGLQIVGPPDGEVVILRVARVLERLHPIAPPRID